MNQIKTPHNRFTRVLIFQPVVLINTLFALIVCILLVYYIVSANFIASTKYEIAVLNKEADTLIERNAILAAEKIQIDNLMALTTFALEHQMVPVQDHESVFIWSGVALQR